MLHVIFYDGECPLCHRAVRFVLAADRKKVFYFAPLKGETAEEKLAGLRLKDPDLDTLVLLQNYQTEHEKTYIEGRGALRVLWLLGGKYALIGWLSFLPSFLFDRIYRLVSRNRFRLFSKKLEIPPTPDRFLR
jgi:predicted DCC family thiol-disulfide oxidoreductase YuxK